MMTPVYLSILWNWDTYSNYNFKVNDQPIKANNLFDTLVMIVFPVIIGPICEEIMFRGYIPTALL